MSAKELKSDILTPRFAEGMKIFHALTQRPVEVLVVKPGSQVVSYDVKGKKEGPFDAMEGELCFPPEKKEKKRRRWNDDEEDERDRDSRDRD